MSRDYAAMHRELAAKEPLPEVAAAHIRFAEEHEASARDRAAVLMPFEAVADIFHRAASVDTHPKDGDPSGAPLVSGAVGCEADETPNV